MTGSECATAGLDSEPVSDPQFASQPNNAMSALSWNAASAIYLFTARAIAVVVQLKYVERYFGGPFSGLNVVSNQVILYVMLFELGLAQAAISFLYEPILERDHERTSALLAAVRSDVRRLILAGGLAVFPLLALYARFLHSQVPYATTVATLFLVAFGAFIQLAAVHFQAYLNAAVRLGWVNLILGAGYLVKTAVGLGLALHFHQYLWLPAASSCLTIVEFLCLKLAFSRVFPEFRKTDWRWATDTIRRRARFALIHKMAGLAYYQSDFIILSFTTSLLVVRDYAKFQYVSAALLSVVGLVAASLTTSIARLQIRHHEENRRRQYVQAQFALSLIGGVLMLAFWFTATTVVALAFGNAPAIGESSVALFGIALFLNVVKTTDDIFFMAKGAFAVGYWIPVIEVPIYVVIGVLLSRKIGFVGILLASIATNLVVSTLIKGIVLARPVFNSTRRQWFTGRFLSMASALVILAPLVGVYAFAPTYLHSVLLRFLITNLVALIYLLVGLRIVVPRVFATGEVAI